MRIRTIRLKNGYKRFRNLTIDLGSEPARIVALVGPNGCGKSSVLDGLLYLANAYDRIGASTVRGSDYHSMDSIPNFSHENVEVEFTTGNFITLFNDRRTTGKEKTIFSFRSSYRYNTELKVKTSQAIEELRRNSYGATDASSLDQKMEENYRRLFSMYNKYLEESDARPSEAKTKIIGDLNKSLKACLEIWIDNLGNIESDRGSLYFRRKDHGKDFDYNVLSSGEKEVVDIILDLYLRQDDYNETIFLLDEPELHISTAIQRKLIIEIDRLIGKDCQLILTTHSIGFLRALQTELRGNCQIIQFTRDMDLSAKPYTLKPAVANAALWRELFEIALDDLAVLVSPKTIIYCEGRAEPGPSKTERGLDAKALNVVFGTERPDTLFVSSGGNTELDQRAGVALAVLGKVFPTVEILLLKDRDTDSGKMADAADREVYLEKQPRFGGLR